MSSTKTKAVTDAKLIADLKFKVKELEHEVFTLKERLDGLRKAKNTTITKREREVIEIGQKRDPQYEAKIEELERQLREKSATKLGNLEDLQKKHAAEMAESERKRIDLQQKLDNLYKRLDKEREDFMDQLKQKKDSSACNHEEELLRLRTKVSDLEGDKSALMLENKDLNERVNSLVLELSVKEARWCEQEEVFKLKLKKQYGEKYAEWMAETERKIEELQQTNQLLRTYLQRSGQNFPGLNSSSANI